MKILFTTPVLSYPPAGGPALRIANSIKALNAIADLHIFARVRRAELGGREAEAYYKNYCTSFHYTPSVDVSFFDRLSNFRFNGKSSLLSSVLNIPLKIFTRVKKLFSTVKTEQADVDHIIKYVVDEKVDIIWFGYGNVSYSIMKSLKARLPHVKMVCDTDSVWSRFVLRELETLKDISRKTEIEEAGKIKEFEERSWSEFMDVTTAVSEVDAEYYRSIAKNTDAVKIFSNVVDLETYAVKSPPPALFKKPCIYLAGSFWKDSPMEQAARWVIDFVLPIVRQTLPEIHFYIIGTGSDRILADIIDPGITITGRLDSVLPYLCNANVSLVPLTFESGTRYKILEAAACEVPIISTTLGAEGIPVADGHDLIIADDAEKFAQSIIEVIMDPILAKKLTTNCKKLIQRKYSIDALMNEGQIILDYLEKADLSTNK